MHLQETVFKLVDSEVGCQRSLLY